LVILVINTYKKINVTLLILNQFLFDGVIGLFFVTYGFKKRVLSLNFPVCLFQLLCSSKHLAASEIQTQLYYTPFLTSQHFKRQLNHQLRNCYHLTRKLFFFLSTVMRGKRILPWLFRLLVNKVKLSLLNSLYHMLLKILYFMFLV